MIKYKYTIELNPEIRDVTIIDNETGVEYKARLRHTKRNGEIRPIVDYSKSGIKTNRKGFLRVPKNENGKYKRKFESNLDSAHSSTTPIPKDLFEDE